MGCATSGLEAHLAHLPGCMFLDAISFAFCQGVFGLALLQSRFR